MAEEVRIRVGKAEVFLGYQVTAQEFNAMNSTATLRAAADGKDNTGARLWSDCTRRAIEFLEGRGVAGLDVLELGCGAHAALATACAELGASSATATDGKASTVDLARKNFEARRARDASIATVAHGELAWGATDAAARRYDVVLGSELMYFSTPIEALVGTIATHLGVHSDQGPPFALLCHIYRAADLPARLAALAEASDLACFDVTERPSIDGDNSRLHVLCWRGDVAALLDAMPDLRQNARPLADVVAEDEGSDDEYEAAFLGAADAGLFS